MAGGLLPQPKQLVQDNAWNPGIAYQIFTYAAGTLTPKATYQDAALTIANTNPVLANARGEVVMCGEGAYRLILKDSLGNLIWDRDNIEAPQSLVGGLSASFAAGDGGNLVGFSQSSAYASGTVGARLKEQLSVTDAPFNAKVSPVDASSAFQAAVDALPASGGTINVPAGTWQLNTAPNVGTKSIFWNISPAATFTGTGTGQNKFPSMRTNGGQIAVGPYYFSQSRIPYTYSTPYAGGVAALQAEMIQPADVNGQSVAIYGGAQGSNPASTANVWAGNFLVKAASGAGGTYQGIEVDIDCFSAGALMKGVSINGIGTADVDVGLEIIRSDATKYTVGIDVMNAVTGVKVRNTTGLTTGIEVGGPNPALSTAAINVKQLVNNGDGLILQRFTDTSPSGYAFRYVNAANDANLAILDILGNLTLANGSITIGGQLTASASVTGQNLKITGGAASMPAGQVCIGNTTASTATAGTATLPSAPAQFLSVFVGSTVYKIPMYAN